MTHAYGLVVTQSALCSLLYTEWGCVHPGQHPDMMLVPTYADLVFDCIRVAWVSMIVCMLFFEMSLGAALWTGIVAGVMYALLVRVMYR